MREQRYKLQAFVVLSECLFADDAAPVSSSRAWLLCIMFVVATEKSVNSTNLLVAVILFTVDDLD